MRNGRLILPALPYLLSTLGDMAGIFHARNQYRGSFADDVMDAVRSDVDEWLLDFTKTRLFSRKELYEKMRWWNQINNEVTTSFLGNNAALVGKD